MHATVALRHPKPEELRTLLLAVGWGGHAVTELAGSISAYTAAVCARADDGQLVGYALVFSDRKFTTMLGELVVHPSHQGRGVGRVLIQAVEAAFPMAPVHVNALGASRAFYEALGYRTSSTPVTAMFKKPGQAAHGKPPSGLGGSST